tara:strand:+ start:715 stop:960 length:246 start_codon:yes stop_codon:yes gene_type:complete
MVKKKSKGRNPRKHPNGREILPISPQYPNAKTKKFKNKILVINHGRFCIPVRKHNSNKSKGVVKIQSIYLLRMGTFLLKTK